MDYVNFPNTMHHTPETEIKDKQMVNTERPDK